MLGAERPAVVQSVSLPLRSGPHIDKHLPNDPVWYLQVWASIPRHRAKRHLQSAARDGPRGIRTERDPYLETSNFRAVSFYHRTGYEIQEAGVPLMPGGPTY